MYEYDDAIEYFWNNHTSYKDKEITLYCLLKFLDNYDLNDLWVREYEKAVSNGIQPRENLQRKYHDRKAD